MQFCTCTEAVWWVEDYRQLLRVGWYPASYRRPKTAFTFDVLDSYHKITLEGKLGLYDFYSSILQKSDNCSRKKAVVSRISLHRRLVVDITRFQCRYHEMLRCVRQWRNLKQIKRGGGGHMETGLDSVPDDAFALECPACPHPDRNLPKGWDQAPENIQYVHAYL